MSEYKGGRPKKNIEDLPKDENGDFLLYCNKCDEEKTLDNYSIDSRSGIGFQTTCKKCEKVYRDSNKEKRRAYLDVNKDKIAEQQRLYYLRNKDRINRWRRNYYSNEGRLKVLTANAERRAKKITSCDGTVTPYFIEQMFIAQDGSCNECGIMFTSSKDSFHIDHIVPLSKEGTHTAENIQLLCPTCNLKKADKMPVGRPSKYSKSFIPILEAMMANGASIEEVAAGLRISKQSLYTYADKYPEFLDAIKRGEEFSKAFWLKLGRESLRDKNFNYTGYYMNMKNRFGWSDKHHIKKDEGSDAVVDLKNASDEELNKIIEG